ncbi:MAG: hypothetical protein Q8Q60_03925 [Candidatus Chromulinivorax sp.]|nr:hypothetical protein [Candidatus Chromulinivorax sp.]
MKNIIKRLVAVCLLMGSGLSYASNTITNKTGKVIELTALDKNGASVAMDYKKGGVAITELPLGINGSYTLSGKEASVSAYITKWVGFSNVADSSIASIPDTVISSNTSYDVILAPDNVTLMLSPVSSNFKAPKTGKSRKSGK